MNFAEMILPEFDREMANTRKVLERVPEDKFGWKPHPKSGAMGWLASHLAHIPSYAVHALTASELDLCPGGVPVPPPPQCQNRAELLARFDRHVAEARAAIAAASDECLMGTWTLLQNGQKVFAMPRAAMIRAWVFNHSIHHRAQLGVYLRLNEVPVPALYGPSADEAGM